MAHNKRDMLWKSIVQEFDEDFVRFFYPDADNIFDLEQDIIFLDTELRQSAPDRDHFRDCTRMDGLLKIPLKNRPGEYRLLVLEVQGYHDYEYPKRVHTNFSRLLDKYPHNISVLVIYAETGKGFKPDSFNYKSLGARLTFEYQPYVIRDQDEAKLELDPNPIAFVILSVLSLLKAGKNNDERLFRTKIRLLDNLKKRNLPAYQEYKLLTFIMLYVDFESKEMEHLFDQEIISTQLKHNTMTLLDMYADHKAYYAKLDGIDEGFERAKLENAGEMIKNGIAPELVQKCTHLDLEVILDIQRKINEEATP